MKKFWSSYRYFGLVLIWVALLVVGVFYFRATSGIMWSAGIMISFIGVMLQIMHAPNFKPTEKETNKQKDNELTCPDCSAKLKYESGRLKFIKHAK